MRACVRKNRRNMQCKTIAECLHTKKTDPILIEPANIKHI